MLKKKSISTIAPPQSTAATAATSTPVFPREASCGLAEWFPTAQVMAARASPATAAMTPMVISAPTMFDRAPMPGRPLRVGRDVHPAAAGKTSGKTSGKHGDGLLASKGVST